MKTTMRLVVGAALIIGALMALPVLGETSSLQTEPKEEAIPRDREVSHVPSLYTTPRFLQEGNNNTVEEEHHDSSDEEAQLRENPPWGEAIGAALLVNLATLVGLLIFIPTLLAGTFCSVRRIEASPEQIHARHQKMLRNYLPSFGAGALLAAAVFLIIPEAILLLSETAEHAEHAEGHRFLEEGMEEEHEEESSVAWKFGTSFLGGYALPLVLGCLFPHNRDQAPMCPVCQERGTLNQMEDNCSCKDEECPNHSDDRHDNELMVEDQVHYLDDGSVYDVEDAPFSTTSRRMPVVDEAVVVEADHSVSPTTPSCVDEGCTEQDHHHEDGIQNPPKIQPSMPPTEIKVPINYNLAILILLGDGFHNFADGIFLGTAFLLCTRSVAYAIVGGTIYHELAQELADYFLLTTHVGLKPLVALTLNFVSGLSVVLGVVVILALPVSATATGCILAISAGVYVHIAASECLPRIELEIKNHLDRFSSMLCFTMGAVPIGLVLLSHGHCDA